MRYIAIFILLSFTVDAHAFCFEEAGEKYNISPRLLMAISLTESNGRHDSIHRNKNGSTDIGHMLFAQQLRGYEIEYYAHIKYRKPIESI